MKHLDICSTLTYNGWVKLDLPFCVTLYFAIIMTILSLYLLFKLSRIK